MRELKIREIGSVGALAKAMKDYAQNPDLALKRSVKALECYRTGYYQDAVVPKIESLYQSIISDYLS